MNLRDMFQRKTPAEVENAAEVSAQEVAPDGTVVPATVIDKNVLRRTNKILKEYKEGKRSLENRLIAHEQFWKMRQWQSGVGEAKAPTGYNVYSTPWLHTCLETRLADAMDAFPTAKFLPRSKEDEEEAKMLSKIAPVILRQNGYEKTYRRSAKYCLENGAFINGVFWDPQARGGLGAIKIDHVDAMNLFWQPGVRSIQDSDNVFYTTLADNDALKRLYPELEKSIGKNNFLIGKYRYDDKVDTSNKSVVVDWYYRKREGTKTVLHYCKYVGETVLYSSENEGETEGYYHHGKYPFVMAPLFEIEGSPFGYGLIDICESTQLQIDLLNKAICDNATEGSRPRYFGSVDNTINLKQLNDPSQRIVEVEGRIDEEHLKIIDTKEISGNYITYLRDLIEQMKFCTANQDVNNGAAPAGVTSYSALSALQETSGKKPRDTNRTFYDAFSDVMYMFLELVRQFYTTPQQFRIDSPDGQREYVSYTNAGLQPVEQIAANGETVYRLPEFDIEIAVLKSNPYKTLEHNEFILQLYNLGAFNPQNVDQALALVHHMDFDDKDEVIETIQKNKTLTDLLLQYQKIALSLAQQVDPAMADQLAQTIVSADAGITAGGGGTVDPSMLSGKKEHPFGAASRAAARESTQVS